MVQNKFILANINGMNFRIHTKSGNGLQAQFTNTASFAALFDDRRPGIHQRRLIKPPVTAVEPTAFELKVVDLFRNSLMQNFENFLLNIMFLSTSAGCNNK